MTFSLKHVLFEMTNALHELEEVKTHYNRLFWKSQWQFFLRESLYSNLFEKLGRNEMKN
jgi:hypothetical protein